MKYSNVSHFSASIFSLDPFNNYILQLPPHPLCSNLTDLPKVTQTHCSREHLCSLTPWFFLLFQGTQLDLQLSETFCTSSDFWNICGSDVCHLQTWSLNQLMWYSLHSLYAPFITLFILADRWSPWQHWEPLLKVSEALSLDPWMTQWNRTPIASDAH